MPSALSSPPCAIQTCSNVPELPSAKIRLYHMLLSIEVKVIGLAAVALASNVPLTVIRRTSAMRTSTPG